MNFWGTFLIMAESAGVNVPPFGDLLLLTQTVINSSEPYFESMVIEGDALCGFVTEHKLQSLLDEHAAASGTNYSVRTSQRYSNTGNSVCHCVI